MGIFREEIIPEIKEPGQSLADRYHDSYIYDAGGEGEHHQLKRNAPVKLSNIGKERPELAHLSDEQFVVADSRRYDDGVIYIIKDLKGRTYEVRSSDIELNQDLFKQNRD